MRRLLSRAPQSLKDAVYRAQHPVRFGSLRRLTPISDDYGFDRGTPVDRYYVEGFLARFAASPDYTGGAIQGRVMEVGGRDYIDAFAVLGDRPGPGITHHVDVLHYSAANPEATIVGSLTEPETLPADAFDCIICTQTLHVIYDVHAAVAGLYRMLAPGGTLLATVPGITRSCVPDRDEWGDWWRFTSLSARRVLEESFPAEHVTVEARGNILTAIGFLHGLASRELRRDELEVDDPDYEVVITIRATKPAA